MADAANARGTLSLEPWVAGFGAITVWRGAITGGFGAILMSCGAITSLSGAIPVQYGAIPRSPAPHATICIKKPFLARKGLVYFIGDLFF